MQLTVSDSGTVRATLSSRAGESTGRARFAGRLFRLNITGDLSTADSTQGQRLSFYLRPDVGVMNGAVTLGAGTGVLSGLEGRVSYWVSCGARDRSATNGRPPRGSKDRGGRANQEL
jgi:hypothetical protein